MGKSSEEKLSKELHYMDPDGGNDLTGLDTNIIVPRIVKVYADNIEVDIERLPDYNQ